jgi:hypothetical protein
MLFKTRWIILPLCSLLICLAFLACRKKHPEQTSISKSVDKKWERQRAELEYRLLQAELALAKSEKLYLVINLKRKELELKLKGTVVWSNPINVIETDSQEVLEFTKRFQGDEGLLIRPLSHKYLFSAQNKTPDSILVIISDAVRAKPELMQRDVPGRFQLLWGYGLILEVRTDIIGKPKSKLKNTMVKVREALRRPFGETRIILKMNPDYALTLYRAVHPGLPTLLYPSL